MPEETIVEDRNDLIAKQAFEEIEAEKEGREPKDLLSTPKKRDDEEAEANQDPDEEPPVDGDDKPEDSKKEVVDGDSDKSDEGEDKAGEAGDDDADKKITEYAEKHRLTYAEAKEDIEKTAEILKQYKNDPAEMAKAMRNKDREFQKLRVEAEKIKKEKAPVFKRMSNEEFIERAKAVIPEKNPEAIAAHRKQFPDRTEGMTDAAIVEELAMLALPAYNQSADKKEAEFKENANKRRESIVAEIPEADRKFIPAVKALLSSADDSYILSDDFDVKNAMYLAKGEKYDADIKEAEARGFKRGKEGAKIIGNNGPSGGSSRPASSKQATTLNDKQKQRAIEMFGNNVDRTDDVCFRMFSETYEEELKKDPKFV